MVQQQIVRLDKCGHIITCFSIHGQTTSSHMWQVWLHYHLLSIHGQTTCIQKGQVRPHYYSLLHKLSDNKWSDGTSVATLSLASPHMVRQCVFSWDKCGYIITCFFMHGQTTSSQMRQMWLHYHSLHHTRSDNNKFCSRITKYGTMGFCRGQKCC